MNKKYEVKEFHEFCKGTYYWFTEDKVYPKISRFYVPKDKIPWKIEFKEYKPIFFISPSKINSEDPLCDLDIGDLDFKPAWNEDDQKNIPFEISLGYPINPKGRTGLRGRGILNKWGPNHEVFPIITRFKKIENSDISKHKSSKKEILQFLAVKYPDTDYWAIPSGTGGGKHFPISLRNEFEDEIEAIVKNGTDTVEKFHKSLDEFYKLQKEIFKGYLDDPRNTDNSWIEAEIYNYHDAEHKFLNHFKFDGEGAKKVKWVDIDDYEKYYPSHIDIFECVAENLNAHWRHVKTHYNALQEVYNTRSDKETRNRIKIPDKSVSWNVELANYNPPLYNSIGTTNRDFSDYDIGSKLQMNGELFQPKWNSLDVVEKFIEVKEKKKFVKIVIDRRTKENKNYTIDKDGYPLNPRGRTGLRGRGALGRWGPNHAADPIVTRWKRDQHTNKIIVNQETKRQILQFIAIERKDNGMWAIPGGMVDPGENGTLTCKREFMEEAMNSKGRTDKIPFDEIKKVNELFDNKIEIYQGYVDDDRNTDNSWMETEVFLFHDETGDLSKFNLIAGDDARKTRWMDVNDELNLFASHRYFLKLVARKLNAHWKTNKIHRSCRQEKYANSDNIIRFVVPDDLVKWKHTFENYAPMTYNSSNVNEWSDPDISDPKFQPKWDRQYSQFYDKDGKLLTENEVNVQKKTVFKEVVIDRTSFIKPQYKVIKEYPMNPRGRTGIKGRGDLDRWGPNIIVFPIVIRWKIDKDKQILNSKSNNPILEFVSIKRKDGYWGIPIWRYQKNKETKTFTDVSSKVFMEQTSADKLKTFFENFKMEIYKGYIDDSRNTDNAWVEAEVNFYLDGKRNYLNEFVPVAAGPDVDEVKWVDIDSAVDVSQDAKKFLQRTADELGAHW